MLTVKRSITGLILQQNVGRQTVDIFEVMEILMNSDRRVLFNTLELNPISCYVRIFA